MREMRKQKFGVRGFQVRLLSHPRGEGGDFTLSSMSISSSICAKRNIVGGWNQLVSQQEEDIPSLRSRKSHKNEGSINVPLYPSASSTREASKSNQNTN